MKKLFLPVICSLFSMGAYAQSPTSYAQGFNIFVQGNLNLINSETDGPVACGEHLTVGGSYQVSNNYQGSFTVSGVPVTLVVGGHVNYSTGYLTINQNGYVKIGSATGSTCWYTDMSGAYSPMRITPGSDYNGYPRINMQVSSNTIGVSASVNPVFQSGLINFTSAFEAMRGRSTCMAALADNAEITNSAGTIIPHTGLPSQIKINLHTGLNVLNVTGSDLNNVTDFIYNNAPDSNHVFVINVTTPASFTWTPGNAGGAIGMTQAGYVLYNFPNVTGTLTIGGYGAIEGTIFAPFGDATKTTNYANIEGQVIAKSFVHGGGEVHYAWFRPTVPGCTGALATVPGFTINSSMQCLSGNSFVFTNTSTGTALSYLWRFGDGTTTTSISASRTYTATGTYNVKLIATGAGGTDSVTHSIVVSETPSTGFSVNTADQYLTGNSYVFTTTSPSGSNTYLWDFGDGNTSTATNPTYNYTATGTFTVTQTVTRTGGCSRSTTSVVHVLADCVDGGGGDGGLESESLGDLVSKREFNKIKASVPRIPDYSKLPDFSKNLVAARTTANEGRLQGFVPAKLNNSTTAKVTTPADLTTITVAKDVFSVDYVRDNLPRAVVMAITTVDRVYNHTKSICDRFRGAKLISTEQVSVNGFNFILFALKRESGNVEYSITFTAGKSANSTRFNLQSKWLISEYAKSDSVFNFQVWATSPADAKQLTGEILTKLAAVMPIEQTDVNFTLPPNYVKIGKRNKGFLELTIANTTNYTDGMIILNESKNESSGGSVLQVPMYLNENGETSFYIPVYDGYEYEGHLYLNGQLTDDIYMADGHWSIDFDPSSTTLRNFKADNNFTRVYADDEFPLYRNVTLDATSSDYVNIYKFVAPGQEKTDLSKYNSYKFFAKGSGKMTIRMIKKSIEKWDDQYKTEIDLDPTATGKYYTISLEDFASDNVVGPLKANDITAVVYSWKETTATDIKFFGDEQSFSPNKVAATKVLTSKKMQVFPNPVMDHKFQCLFASDADRDLDMVITNLTGEVVYTAPVHATAGYNTVNVELPAHIAQSVYIIKMSKGSVKYDVNKISVLK